MAERVHLGTEFLEDAQKKTGLSNERLGRALHISEKTWRRWRENGEVPVHSFPRVAEVLNLRIEQDEPLSVRSPAEDDPLVDRMTALESRLGRLEEIAQATLDVLRPEPSAGTR